MLAQHWQPSAVWDVATSDCPTNYGEVSRAQILERIAFCLLSLAGVAGVHEYACAYCQ